MVGAAEAVAAAVVAAAAPATSAAAASPVAVSPVAADCSALFRDILFGSLPHDISSFARITGDLLSYFRLDLLSCWLRL